MSKSTMNKIYRSFFSLIFCLLMFTVIYGCGNGPDTGTTTVSYNVALTANTTSLAAGNNTVVTATVTNGSGEPVSGLDVTFALLINNSNPELTPSGVVTTNVSGEAVKVYTAGSTGTSAVEDIVQASVTGATGFVIITRTASTATTTGYRMTVTATPVQLAAGAISVIVANVINNATGNGASGMTVNFELLIDNSDATLTPVNLTTDASGTAIATYTAGTETPSLSIQDVIKASITEGASGAAIITRLPNVGTGNRIISFTEDPETNRDKPLIPPFVYVIMEVTVTTDDLKTPVKVGTEVTFSIILGDGIISDAVLPIHNTAEAGDTGLKVLTDDQGKAFVTFTRPASGSGDTVIRAQISGTNNGGDAARIVYWTDGL